MNRRIENYISWLNRLKAGRRRMTSLVIAMSVVVSGNVFWLMRGTGTALAGDLEPSCGIEDHEHTDACYITASSGRENASDWEQTIPETTGNYAADLINCAASQTGYSEYEDGYTRYGDWYGNATADWNVMFISFVMHYSGISQDQIPYGSGCWAWQVKLEEAGLLTDMTALPSPGDILLTDNDGDGKCDRAGIIADITEGIISTIEGDVEGKVDACKYSISDASLYGYIPVNTLFADQVSRTYEGQPEEAPAEEQSQDKPDSEQPGGTDEEKSSVGFSGMTESGIEVNVSAPEGAFPEGVTMSAADVDDEDIIAQAEGAVGEDKDIKGSIAVDITFKDSEGNEIEPAEGIQVSVSISIPEDRQLEAEDFRLFHINEEGIAEVEGAQVSQSEAQFTSESFSIFVVTATGERDKNKVHAYISNANLGNLYDHREWDPATGQYGDYIVNDASYPYVLRVGDEITLTGYNDNQTPKFVLEDNYSNGHENITIVSQPDATGNEVTCVLRGVGSTAENQTVKVRLQGTDEIFYVKVDDYNKGDYFLDLDNTAPYTRTDGSTDGIPEYRIPFGSNVRIIGTPFQGYYGGWGIFLDNNQNPNGWIVSTTPFSTHTIAGGDLELTFTADTFHEYWDNSQILTMCGPDGQWRKVRITIVNDGVLDHADIEIADGGVYTNVQIEGGDNGELYKTVTQYQSFVYDVNYSELYDGQGGVVQLYDSNNNYAPYAVSRYFGGINPATNDYNDYWSDPRFVPGNSQFELTSKYSCPPGSPFNESLLRWSHKKFFYQDVEGARFDVELQIIPKHIQKYIWDASANGGTGDWTPVPGTDVEYDIQYDQGSGLYRTRTDGGAWTEYVDLKPVAQGGIVDYKNEVFDLGKQAVIDAYNKCPNHSGLDFTVHHDLATIEFTASKELIGRPLQDNEFEFRIFSSIDDAIADPAPAGVASAKNSADGKVVFENIEFENVSGEHTYTYYMKEIRGTDDTVVYDPVIYKIVIDVNKVYPGQGPGGTDLVVPVDISSFTRLKTGGDPMVDSDYLTADQFIFQNITDSFKLPETGGMGIVPHLAAGTLFAGAALFLLAVKPGRRKEAER